MRRTRFLAVAALLLSGCEGVRDIAVESSIIHARFDPDAGVIPMPSDIVRDAAANKLALPVDDPDNTFAERELYEFLNTRDAWSVASQADVKFTGAIDPATVTTDTLILLERRADGVLLKHDAPRIVVAADGLSVVVDPPLDGWRRGSVIALALRGGPEGVAGPNGELVECDAAFYFLRLEESLSDHPQAFPGETLEEKQANADKLEEIRLSLAPWFDEVELQGIPRREVAALWTFTTTLDVELTMSKQMRKMPLPIDLLIDRETARIDLPVYPEDSELEVHSKEHLNRFDGFGPTMTPQFEFTAPIDPATISSDSVELWHIASPAVKLESSVIVSSDAMRVELHPAHPLREHETYVMVARDTIRDAEGKPVAPMSVGHLLQAKQPILANGLTTIAAVPQEDAERLEPTRASQIAALDAIGRETLLAAWPYTIMSITQPLVDAQTAAERLQAPADPQDVTSMSTFEAALDFPLGALTLWNVDRVYNGVIQSPDFLDPTTRSWNLDGSAVMRPIPFTLTIPEAQHITPGQPLPVVIFGHGLVTERRFVLSVSDALAEKGFAVIAIDFPYHGSRSVCTLTGPLCLPDPLSNTGELICPNLCENGSTCGPGGSCLDDVTGAVTPLKKFPIIQMVQATGAAFIEVESVTNTREHFMQAVVDLGALSRSIRLGDWKPATGYDLDGDNVTYLGQSLGSILGALYAPLDPAIERAVFNVPGAGLVPMFDESIFFGLQIEAFYERHDVPLGSAQHARFQNIAHWMIDTVDPINVARHITGEPIPGVAVPEGGRHALVQMATLDFIIPEAATMRLVNEGSLPMEDYVGGHAFIVLPVEPAYGPGIDDAANFLDGTWVP